MGFSMVVGLLRADSPTGRTRLLLVRDVAEISLCAIGLSLLPLVLHHYDVSESLTWRLCSALAIAAWIVGLVGSIRRIGRSRAVYPWRINWVFATVGPAVNVVGLAMLSWNVAAAGSAAGARFVSALGLMLLLAGGMFIQATFTKLTDA